MAAHGLIGSAFSWINAHRCRPAAPNAGGGGKGGPLADVSAGLSLRRATQRTPGHTARPPGQRGSPVTQTSARPAILPHHSQSWSAAMPSSAASNRCCWPAAGRSWLAPSSSSRRLVPGQRRPLRYSCDVEHLRHHHPHPQSAHSAGRLRVARPVPASLPLNGRESQPGANTGKPAVTQLAMVNDRQKSAFMAASGQFA